MKFKLNIALHLAMLFYCGSSSENLLDIKENLDHPSLAESELQHKRVTRNAIKNPSKRWPDNKICYRFDPVFSPSQRQLVRQAMDHIESHTFIIFEEDRVARIDCVSITAVPIGSGCNSNIGYLAKPQNITLPIIHPGTGCFTMFQIVHELLHTCGLYHQHNAHNRDDYVDILWSNIKPASVHAFVKRNATETTSFGYPYDYDSVMHYGPKISSANRLDTIVPKSRVAIGQRTHLSVIDILKLKRMYPPLKTTKSAIETAGLESITSTLSEIERVEEISNEEEDIV